MFPYQSEVLQGLESCLDDKKRLVRREAVRTRSNWYMYIYTTCLQVYIIAYEWTLCSFAGLCWSQYSNEYICPFYKQCAEWSISLCVTFSSVSIFPTLPEFFFNFLVNTIDFDRVADLLVKFHAQSISSCLGLPFLLPHLLLYLRQLAPIPAHTHTHTHSGTMMQHHLCVCVRGGCKALLPAVVVHLHW